MSTILKALRRLELEKSAQEGRPLKDEVTASPETGSRRGIPLLAVMIAACALGLGLGSSLLWLWPRESAAPQAAKAPPVAEAPRAPRRAGALPVPPVEVAALPAIPAVAPEPAASVASAPPPPAAAFASPVAVISRPEPRAAVPAPPIPVEPKPEAVAAKPEPPVRGSLPPFARRQAVAAAEPPPAAPAPRPEPVARAYLPDVFVSSTVWHPQRDRRLAIVAFEGGASRELHEGDAIGPLVVSEIGPSSVVFLHDGVELRRRVGAKN